MTIRSGKIAFSEYIPARMIHMNSTPGKKKPMSPALKRVAALSVIPCLALSGCVSDKAEPAPPPAPESSPAPETCVPAHPETGLHPQAAEFLRAAAGRTRRAAGEATAKRATEPAALAPWRLTEEPLLAGGSENPESRIRIRSRPAGLAALPARSRRLKLPAPPSSICTAAAGCSAAYSAVRRSARSWR